MQIIIDIPKHIYEWVTTDKRAYSILNTGHMVIMDAIKNATPLGEAGKDINAPTTDCVSRKEVMQSKPEWLNENVERDTSEQTLIDREYSKGWNKCLQVFLDNIKQLPSIKPVTQWHKTETRPLTDEEKEVYGEEYTYIYDCKMPDDGQEVLVKTKWGIEKTTYHTDDGCYFEDYEDDVIAWTELPEWEE